MESLEYIFHIQSKIPLYNTGLPGRPYY